MSLSNTAVPTYYGQFRDAVLRGEIPVCETIAMEMKRIDALIADPRYYYDDEAVEGFIRFCENELCLRDGSPLHLLDTFKLWSEEIFGWYYFAERSVYRPYKDRRGGRYIQKTVRKRLINKQFLIIARSAAKSLYGSCLQSYFLAVDNSTTAQTTTAPTVRQADEVLAPIRTALARAHGPWFQYLTEGSLQNTTGSRANRVKMASTKEGIVNFLTNSKLTITPMTVDSFQGPNIKCATIDEWLSCDIRENIIGAAEQCAAKGGEDDYLILAMSSEGTVRNSIGDTIKMELMDILRGKYKNDHVSIWYYRLDDIKEVQYPDLWLKANPNIGKTVSWDIYQSDKERMEHEPATKNDILAKRFGIPVEGNTYFFTYEETLTTDRKLDFWQMVCALGIDLSQGDDFCAFTFLFPLNDSEFGIKTRCYISSLTFQNLTLATRNKYEEFIREGSLMVFEGTVLDLDEVYDDLYKYIEDNQYDVRAVGYDPYNAKDFMTRWEAENGPFAIEKVRQGVKTETVPLGEIKKMTENRLMRFDQNLMTFCMGHCIILSDTNGNRKLSKARRSEKIDSVSALLDAYVAYKAYKENFE